MAATAGTIFGKMKALDERNVGVVAMVASDRILQRLIAAWENVGRRLLPDHRPFEEVPEGLPESEHERWLWSRVEPDPFDLWSEMAGLPDAPHIHRSMRLLMNNGVVFPDGTLSQWAVKWLKEKAKQQGVSVDGDEGDD